MTPKQLDRYKKAELAKIHIAKQQLGLDDETYRAMLNNVCGVNSSKDLTPKGRAMVLEHLKKSGFVESKRKGEPHNKNSQSANAPRIKKIGALLADAGRDWDYALNMAKHMYKKDALEFCTGDELSGIITALVKDKGKREKEDSDG